MVMGQVHHPATRTPETLAYHGYRTIITIIIIEKDKLLKQFGGTNVVKVEDVMNEKFQKYFRISAESY